MYYQPRKKSNGMAIVALTALLVVGFVVYDRVFISKTQAADNPLESDEAVSAEGDMEPESIFSPEQLALLAKIESIALDASIFDDPIFHSLQDWTVELGTQPTGRPNPFAPTGGIVPPAASGRTTPRTR